MSNLVIPFVVWGSPPEHSITCCVTRPPHLYATGSASGTVCLWKMEEGRLVPRQLCLGHETPVTALAVADIDGNCVVVSVSTGGQLCLWDACDGLCLASSARILPRGWTHSLETLPGGRHVAVASNSVEVYVIDLLRMQVVSIIRGHTDWVKGIAVCQHNGDGGPSTKLISLCLDGQVRFWNVFRTETVQDLPYQTVIVKQSQLQQQEEEAPAEDDDDSVDVRERMKRRIAKREKLQQKQEKQEDEDEETYECVRVSPLGSSFFVLSHSNCVLFTTVNAHEKWRLSCDSITFDNNKKKGEEEGVSSSFALNCRGDEFVGGEYVDEQHFVLITERGKGILYRMGDEFLSSSAPSADEQPSPVYHFVWSKEEAQQDDNRRRCVGSVSRSGGLVSMGDAEGCFCVWKIPELGSTALPDCLRTTEIKTQHKGVFKSGWIADENQNRVFVSSSCVVEENLFLIRGYSDGKVSIIQLPFDSRPRFLRGHRGAVTALLSMTSENMSKVIISGGDDCSIKVWALASGELLHHWAQHSDSVVKLLPTLQCLHLYTSHPAPVTSVRLRLDQDYLLVGCEDTSLSVWEINTGLLEACVFGRDANNIADTAADLSRNRKSTSLRGRGLSVMHIRSQDIGGDAPGEVLLLNIKKLITGLYTQTPTDSASASGFSSISGETEKISKNVSVSGGGGGMVSMRSTLQSSVSYLLYSYLLPWGVSSELDQLMTRELLLEAPSPQVAVGARGHKGKITTWTPFYASNAVARWTSSPYMTALHLLASVSYTRALLQTGEQKNALSHIMTYFCSMLPERVPGFIEPALGLLSNFWQDAVDDIMQSTHSIFGATLDRQSPEERNQFVQLWGQRLQSETRRGMKSRALAVIVLGIVAAERPGGNSGIPRELEARVAKRLVELLFQDQVSLQVFAAEILGKGYMTWRNYIRDHVTLIQRLFNLTQVRDPPFISRCANHSLMQIGAAQPLEFVIALAEDPVRGASSSKRDRREIGNTAKDTEGGGRGGELGRNMSAEESGRSGIGFDPKEYSAHLMVIGALVKKNPAALLPELPRVAQAVVRSLDPNVPQLRESCLKAATQVLHSIVSKFPMISFHQESQRLALGTSKNTIIIYDLKTANKLYTLDGHAAPVTALCFSADGKMLASYALKDAQVRLWQIQSGLFGFGGSPKCICQFSVSRVDRELSASTLLESVRLEWNGPKTLLLVRGWEGSFTFQL